jgi:hypothetical protein
VLVGGRRLCNIGRLRASTAGYDDDVKPASRRPERA